MRSASGLLLLSMMLIPPHVAWTQSNPPSVDTVTKALSRPAGTASVQRPASDSSVTPGMLTGRTRGITLVNPAAAGPVGADADMCTAGSGTCALVVEFESGSAVLTPAAVATLDVLGAALVSPSTAGFKFRIEGHTDTVGSREVNLTLSDQRARAVAAYLEDHFAITPARLKPVGVGKDKLLISTPDQTPEARNRRVQVINLGA